MSNAFYNYQSVFLPRTIVPSARFNAHFTAIETGFDAVEAALATKLDGSRNIIAGTGLTGGGAIINDVTLSFDQSWGDARYALFGHNHAGLYAPAVHGHEAAQITSGVFDPARLPVFAGGSAPGAVPSSLGGITKFLREDGRWEVPAGGGSGGGVWGAIAGTLSDQTDLQSVLTSKAAVATTISAGTGMTGGGNLSANRTLSLDIAYTDARYAQIVTLTAGTGLTGGGSLAANRTFSLDLSYTDARYAAAGHTHAFLPLIGGTLSGPLSVAGLITSTGSSAGLIAHDRTSNVRWMGYASGNIWRLWLEGVGDLMTVDSAGWVTATSFVASSWFRSTGDTGWYSTTYGGGIHMVDTTYVRTYNGKSFYSTGSILANGDITAFSDIRLKTDIKPIARALDKVGDLRGVTYTRIDTGERQAGLIAQEVLEVLPEVVSQSPEGYLTLAYGNVVGLLVEAIKELRVEVAELRNAAAK